MPGKRESRKKGKGMLGSLLILNRKIQIVAKTEESRAYVI